MASSTSWKLQSFFKDFVPGSPAALPYLCYLVAFIIILMLMDIIFSLILILMKPKKSPTINITFNRHATAGIFNPYVIGSEQSDESEAVEETENDATKNAKAQPEINKHSSKPSNSSAPKPIRKPKQKKSVQDEELCMLIDMVQIIQRMFFIIVFFLLLAILTHVDFFMVSKMLSSDRASDSTEKDTIVAPKDVTKCSDCGYGEQGTNMGQCPFSVEKHASSDDVNDNDVDFEESNSGKNPLDKESKSTVPASIIT